ncbi:hypothetical protein DFH07DRAFT_529849 [Mycena maculata]|uniref:Uncharacterized protein n=1 Tax=Mycena maculata TaxID=230809 RepID=A0AAD7IV81_9AGAR|nr:hypothetical protein DFH07DRAFT_529849 [Mycena maculata]
MPHFGFSYISLAWPCIAFSRQSLRLRVLTRHLFRFLARAVIFCVGSGIVFVGYICLFQLSIMPLLHLPCTHVDTTTILLECIAFRVSAPRFVPSLRDAARFPTRVGGGLCCVVCDGI